VRNEISEITQEIRGAERVLITSHENPDSDALGSMLALGLGLKKLGKAVTLYNKDGVPDVLGFLPNSELIQSSIDDIEGTFDLCIVVDCPTTDRAGKEFQEFLSRGTCSKVIIIDHHQTMSSAENLSLLDPEASSTGVLIYSILKDVGVEIDSSIAENLYTTIVGDTGSFRYSNTNSETFSIAAGLVQAGAEPEKISQALYESEPLKKLKLLGLVLPTLQVVSDNRIASLYVERTMFEITGTDREDTEGMVNIPRSIKGVEVALLFRQEKNNSNPAWKVSLRSKGDVDVSKIAENFGGGGHKKAAGCNISGELSETMQKIYDSINEALR
jgi:bifunctional oligoribonuclease and PAP phosphatase NrnA